MGLLVTTVVFLVIWNRWWLFERFLGKAGMYLFDAVLCTVSAARLIASPEPTPVLSYTIAVISAIVAFSSAKDFVHHVKQEKKAND